MTTRHYFLALFLCICQFSFSQITPKNKPEDFGFTEFSIKGKLDSINFIVSDTVFSIRKPIFLFCQGSLPFALFWKEDSLHTWNQTFNFDNYKEHLNEFYFIEIAKPGIPVFSNSADSNYWHIDPITHKTPAKYFKNNYLDYYVSAANDVIEFLLKQKWVDKSKIVVAGHSQGGKVAIKLAAKNKHITHLISLSSEPYTRFAINIKENKWNFLQGKITSEQYQKNIDRLNTTVEKWYAHPNDIANKDGETFGEIISFYEPMLPYLLQLKIPLFVAYGTDDVKADGCNMLPFEFARNGKANLTLKPYLDCDHGFVKTIYDKTGKEIGKEDNFNKVADAFFNWLK